MDHGSSSSTLHGVVTAKDWLLFGMNYIRLTEATWMLVKLIALSTKISAKSMKFVVTQLWSTSMVTKFTNTEVQELWKHWPILLLMMVISMLMRLKKSPKTLAAWNTGLNKLSDSSKTFPEKLMDYSFKLASLTTFLNQSDSQLLCASWWVLSLSCSSLFSACLMRNHHNQLGDLELLLTSQLLEVSLLLPRQDLTKLIESVSNLNKR